MKAALFVSAIALAAATAPAAADVVTVNGTADLYKAAGDDGSNGTSPVIIELGNATSITLSVTGRVSVNIGSGDNFNDPDGVGSAQGEINTGFGLFSGIRAPTAGFLAGVFVSGALRVSAPAALDFTSTGLGTDFSSLNPLNSQVFFIGDGSNGAGATQTFYIPQAGRGRQLVLGLTDACGYSGAPGCYGDNTGAFVVNYTLNGTSAVPEPATWGTMMLGFGGLGYAMRRRRSAGARVRFA